MLTYDGPVEVFVGGKRIGAATVESITHEPIVLTGEFDGVTLVEPQDPGPRSVRYVGCSPYTVSMNVTVNDEATPAPNRILRAWRMVHPWRHEWAPPARKPSPKQRRKAKRQAQRKARRRQR